MMHIKLKNVYLNIPIYQQHGLSLRETIKNKISSRYQQGKGNSLVVNVLRDVNVEINEGDKLALIGRNGAGKTSLLRVIAGIYQPSAGEVSIKGKITTLLGTGFGIDEDSTGYENIFKCGIYLGFSKKQMKEKADEIISFSELEECIHLPLRTYSEGMKARLSFAISTSYSPNILVADEGIGAGDAVFYEKAQKRVNTFMSTSGMLVLASHSEGLLRQFCTKGLLLDKGMVLACGDLESVLEQYNELTKNAL
jgi:ABC-type polysaccharide/polyol phosphate transport system ATPase subunit